VSGLSRTPLWALHAQAGAKMAAFAGYDMPLHYDGMGVLKEHLHTRSAAGLFDVSHMGQALLVGDDPAAALETLVPSDIVGLETGKTRYTLLLNDDGGIVDDLMVTRRDARTLYLVVNAARKNVDYALLLQKLAGRAELQPLPDRALLALQGPKAASLFPSTLRFMESEIRGDVWVSRSGYTGEDGFEFSVPANGAENFARDLLKHDSVKWIGLGARDSLRLEAGLCLYGHDLDETTTPIEANLKWTIPKRRREAADFPGAAKILKQLADGPSTLRVGLRPDGRAPVREGAELFANGEKIGHVTSGGFGPTLDAPVAMGYLRPGFTNIEAMVRGTARPCTIAPLPFVPHAYKKD
jgi:aminomethyltransferase